MAVIGVTVEVDNSKQFQRELAACSDKLQQLAAETQKMIAVNGRYNSSSDAVTQRTKNYESRLEALKSKLSLYRNEFDRLSKELAINAAAHDQLEKELKEAKSELDKIEQSSGKASLAYQKQEKVVNELEKALKDNEATQEKGNRTLQKTETQLTKTEAQVAKLGNEMNTYRDKVEKASKSNTELGEEAKKAAEKAEKGWTVAKDVLADFISNTLHRAIDAVKNLATETFKAGTEFESAMSKVAAISGASGDEIERLTAKAQQMGKTTKFTASESAEAFNYMAMAGWKTEEMLDGLDGILNLAAASGADLATTSDIVTDALTGMGYAAKDSTRLADVMAAAAANANTTVEKMGVTFQYTTPIAGSLGYTMEDVALAIGLMANAGVKGERAGTALRSIMQRLASNTSHARDTMEKLGVEVLKADGTMRPFRDVLRDARKAFQGLDAAQKTSTAHTVAGQEAMAGFLAIMNASDENFDSLARSIDNCDGAAQQMADTMLDNLGGDITILRSKIEGLQVDLMKKLAPAIREAVKRFSELLDKVDWDAFGESVKRAINKAIDVFEWIINHKDLVVGALKAIVAAFAVSKVLKFAQSLGDTKTELVKLASGATTVIGKMTGLNLSLGGVGKAATGGATAFKLFNGAIALSPLGAWVAVAAAAVGVIGLVAATTNRTTNVYKENTKATKRLREEQKELTSSLEENAKARQKNLDTANDELKDADKLVNRLDELSKATNKTTKQKEEMAEIVEELNKLIPNLNLEYDKENDKLNKVTDSILANVEATRLQNKAKAEQANMKGITADIAKVEEEAAKATEQHTKNQEAYTKAYNERVAFENKYTPQQISNNIGLQTQLQRLAQSELSAKKAMEQSKKVMEGYSGELGNLKGSYEEAEKAAKDFAKKADISVGLANLKQTVAEAGREIPASIIAGIEAGSYAIPQSIEELDRLIKFDKSVQKAGLAGSEVTYEFSKGILSGKTSVDEAMKGIQASLDLSRSIIKAYDDGKYISKNIAEGLLDGSVSQATAELNMKLGEEFGKMIEDNSLVGTEIATRLGNGIRDGSINPIDAVNQLKSYIDFKDIVAKAEEAGIKIPASIAEKIQAGELEPNLAVVRMQNLISYQKSITDAGLSGVKIPENFAAGIMSGEMSAVDAVNHINDLVEFSAALEKTGIDGGRVPQELARQLLNGEVSVESAVSAMNNWIKFDDAVGFAYKGGRNVDVGLQQSILNGKILPETAASMVNSGIVKQFDNLKKDGTTAGQNLLDGTNSGLRNAYKLGQVKSSAKAIGTDYMLSPLQSSIDAHSPSRKAATIGGYFLDGVNSGISNQNKRNSIFSSISRFGSSLLSKLRSSLQEHSPSKATEQMGQYLLQGLSNGIDDEEDDVLEQIKNLGQSMLGTLDTELAQGISNSALQGLSNAIPSDFGANISADTSGMRYEAQNQRNELVDAFKEALGQMKIEMDDQEMGTFVDKTVTKLIYN